MTFDVNTLNGYRLEAGMPKSGQSELLMDPANGMASIMDTGTNVIDVPVYVQGLSLEVDGGGMLDFGFNSQIIGVARVYHERHGRDHHLRWHGQLSVAAPMSSKAL